LFSCDFYNFSQPQPYDQEKLYRFPDALLGKWTGKDTGTTYGLDITVPLNGKGGYHLNNENAPGNTVLFSQTNEGNSFYYINTDYLIVVFSEKNKILTGAWPKLNKNNEFVYQPEGFGRMYAIKYDSLNKPIDTVSNYIISGDRIFEKDQDRFLERGYAYTRVKDTITVIKIDSNYIDLGQNAFLRKLTDSLYVFNINNAILSLENGVYWWRLIIFEIAGDGLLNQWECSAKTGELPCMFYDRPSKYDQFYFDCRWSTAEMLRLFREGYFKKEDVLIRIDK